MIHLYGHLEKKYGRTHAPNVKSAAEAIRAMEAIKPGFRRSIVKDAHYRIVIGEDIEKGKTIPAEELNIISKGDVHIMPVPEGAGGSGGLTTILGAVLVVVGAVLTYFPATTWLGYPMMKVGFGLMIGGVAQMIAGTPTTQSYADREDADSRPSYYFNGPVNATQGGLTIPVAYGQTFIGSIVVSAGMQTAQEAKEDGAVHVTNTEPEPSEIPDNGYYDWQLAGGY